MLADRIIRFINDPTSDSFDRLALEVFQHQFKSNGPYQRFCRVLGVSPSTISSWTEVPPLSTERFKEAALTCGKPQATFLTTGTTRGPENRGRHLIARLDVYRASAIKNFAKHVVPEGGRYTMVVLAPSLEEAPESSLAQMIDWVSREFASSVEHYLHQGKLEEEKLYGDLAKLSAAGTPVLLLCLTRALVELGRVWGFQGAGSRARRKVVLAAGSRIMDTGGSKGSGREVSRQELVDLVEALLGLDENRVINEYGMTEMCSQFYDNTLAAQRAEDSPRRKVVPHWVKTRVVDPLTLQEVREGHRGLLMHFDLANVESVSALLTEDVGRRLRDGFEIEGRLAGADPRGCSLAMG